MQTPILGHGVKHLQASSLSPSVVADSPLQVDHDGGGQHEAVQAAVGKDAVTDSRSRGCSESSTITTLYDCRLSLQQEIDRLLALDDVDPAYVIKLGMTHVQDEINTFWTKQEEELAREDAAIAGAQASVHDGHVGMHTDAHADTRVDVYCDSMGTPS